MQAKHSTRDSDELNAASLPRAEYPRPDLVRPVWQCLNGTWDFAFDDDGNGRQQDWQTGTSGDFKQRIVVPYPFEASRSGIGDSSIHAQIWYRRHFTVPTSWRTDDQRIILHIGAVDYRCEVWINGQSVGTHEGGYTPLALDITDALTTDLSAEQTVVVWVEDQLDVAQPRGKQYWKRQSESIFYTRTTGIWQSVWLEPVPVIHITALSITTDPVSGTVSVRAELSAASDGLLHVVVRQNAIEQVLADATGPVSGGVAVTIPSAQPWTPEDPHLYDVQISLIDAARKVIDQVDSYCGLRSIAIKGNQVLLNGRPYYQRLILDQGFFPTGQYSAPTDDDLRMDVEWAKRFGFNGARKHQKVEDPRWLYWCDRLGFLVWDEMPSAWTFSSVAQEMVLHEWPEVIRRDRNHPCVVVWVPFNESWGVEQVQTNHDQQEYVRRVVELTRQLDPTRPVVDNDGWEHLKLTDLCTIHDYAKTSAELQGHHEGFRGGNNDPGFPRRAYADGHSYNGSPILYTEYGGIALQPPGENLRPDGSTAQEGDAWGYAGVETDPAALVSRFTDVTAVLLDNPDIRGLCYTQLTDIEQEINGLLTYDRRPKADPAAIRKALRV